MISLKAVDGQYFVYYVPSLRCIEKGAFGKLKKTFYASYDHGGTWNEISPEEYGRFVSMSVFEDTAWREISKEEFDCIVQGQLKISELF